MLIRQKFTTRKKKKAKIIWKSDTRDLLPAFGTPDQQKINPVGYPLQFEYILIILFFVKSSESFLYVYTYTLEIFCFAKKIVWVFIEKKCKLLDDFEIVNFPYVTDFKTGSDKGLYARRWIR